MLKQTIALLSLSLVTLSAQAATLICKSSIDPYDRYHLIIAETKADQSLQNLRVYHAFSQDIRQSPGEYGFSFAMTEVKADRRLDLTQDYALRDVTYGGDYGDSEPVPYTGRLTLPIDSLIGSANTRFDGRLLVPFFQWDERLNCEIRGTAAEYPAVAFPREL